MDLAVLQDHEDQVDHRGQVDLFPQHTLNREQERIRQVLSQDKLKKKRIFITSEDLPALPFFPSGPCGPIRGSVDNKS